MSKMNDCLDGKVDLELPEANAELYDCDFIFDLIGIPKPVVGFNLCEASFLHFLLLSCTLTAQKTLSSGCTSETVLRDAQSMLEEASKLMHRIREVQKELEDYIYPRKIADYLKKEEPKNE